MSTTARRRFTVMVADNFHYMDESESYEHGSFDTLEGAIHAAKGIVDAYLGSAFKPGMSAKQLYDNYVAHGEDPYIRGAETSVPFSAWTYAKQRCAELCARRARQEGGDAS